ncbi:MAG: hypothetical protein DWQ04_05220 [Chloroflexi bacterium]|nr:MAG: hypothetical protein DWQ04_05220 [Chloroflexota bacterium]
MDGLEAEWGESVRVVRLNVHDAEAKPLLAELDFRFTPTFILLDESGAESWRTFATLEPDVARDQVRSIQMGK